VAPITTRMLRSRVRAPRQTYLNMFDASIDVITRFRPPQFVRSRVVHLQNVAYTVMEYACGLSGNLCLLRTECF